MRHERVLDDRKERVAKDTRMKRDYATGKLVPRK
jgi:hypothetical protein